MSLKTKDNTNHKIKNLHTIKHGNKTKVHEVIYYFKKNKSNKIIIIIPKKVVKKAVDRNKIRRRIKAIANQNNVIAIKGVIRVQKNIINKKYSVLKKDINNLYENNT